MSMNRREVRDSAFKILFEYSLRNDTVEELYALSEEVDEITVNDAVRQIVDGTVAHLEEIDGIIQKYSPKRVISRIPSLNLTVMRIAIWEILYDDQTPANAAVSEALLLAERYTYFAEDIRFINGLLGAFVRDRNQQEGANQS